MLSAWWRLSPLLFWASSLMMLPLLIWQGRRTRRNTVRLPEASGPVAGQWGSAPPQLSVLVIGESTAAGVGVERHDQGLASQLARCLQAAGHSAVAWHTLGRNGARLDQVIAMVEEASLPAADWVLLSMGVNDTTGFTRLSVYRRQLQRLRALLREHYPSPLVLLSVPPMHRFTALPQPLRLLVGWRARQLDWVKRSLAARSPEEFRYLAYPAMTDISLLARDGYHPGEIGYRAMASAIAGQLSDSVDSASLEDSLAPLNE